MDFFSSLIDGFWTFLRFIGMTITNLITALSYIGSSTNSIGIIIGYMPAVISGACLAFLAFAVVRFLLLR